LVLGKEMEEALLYDDMLQDLVRQVVRRLAAIQMP
jgi:outer membrane lipopolysaccharide assembly protein LptE/RlpB